MEKETQGTGHTELLGSASTSPSNMVMGHDPSLGGIGVASDPLLQTPQNRHFTDAAADVEYPDFFNFSDDFADVLGFSPANPDSVNPQNLAFLYRFL